MFACVATTSLSRLCRRECPAYVCPDQVDILRKLLGPASFAMSFPVGGLLVSPLISGMDVCDMFRGAPSFDILCSNSCCSPLVGLGLSESMQESITSPRLREVSELEAANTSQQHSLPPLITASPSLLPPSSLPAYNLPVCSLLPSLAPFPR